MIPELEMLPLQRTLPKNVAPAPMLYGSLVDQHDVVCVTREADGGLHGAFIAVVERADGGEPEGLAVDVTAG